MTGPHHRPLPDHWALLCGREPPDGAGFRSQHLQIIFNNTSQPCSDERPHAHARSDEVYIVIDGAMDVDVDGTLCVVQAGEYLCVPSGTIHQVTGVAPPVKSFVIRAPSVDDKLVEDATVTGRSPEEESKRVAVDDAVRDLAAIARLLENYERSMLRAEVRQSGRVAELLSDAFVEIGCSGRVYDKPGVVGALESEPFAEVVADDFNVRLLAPDVALVTFSTTRLAPVPMRALRSSVWTFQEGAWTMVFHQGTPA
jgi:mannose-6-phosphate isomerase-like protein (cupin superfamily)